MIDDEKVFKKYLERYKVNDYDNIIQYVVFSEYDILIEYANGLRLLYDLFTGYERGVDLREVYNEKCLFGFKIILNRLMIQNGYTQSSLAKKINVSQQTVSNYLRGTSIPSYITLSKIADVFDCKEEDLYFRICSREKHVLL